MKNLVRPFAVVLPAVCGLVLLPFCCGAFAQEPMVVDGIAAIVNGDVITISEVRTLSAPREKQLRTQYTGQELEKQLKATRDLALKDLIDRQLVIQAFKKEKYEIPDHFVDQRMHEIIRENFGGDRNTFIKTLEAQNYTLGEFKQKEMESMIVQAMRSHNVKTKNIISPTKIEDYYRKHRDEFTSKDMPVGRISNIIDYAGNYYILKVEDKQGGTTKSLNEARPDIEKKLIQEEAQQIQERWIASLRQKAYIKTF